MSKREETETRSTRTTATSGDAHKLSHSTVRPKIVPLQTRRIDGGDLGPKAEYLHRVVGRTRTDRYLAEDVLADIDNRATRFPVRSIPDLTPRVATFCRC
jgi:hypothetical protein